MTFIVLLSFMIFFFVSILVTEGKIKDRYGNIIFLFSFVVLAFLIGFRDGWPDENVYIEGFMRAPKIWEIKVYDEPFGYVEKGYLYLASLVKSFNDDFRIYLLTMGGISMYLLYKSLYKFCIYPILGLCDYIARFLLNRDFTQMRSSLAILLIILATKFIFEKKVWKYLLVVLLAYQFHHMSLLAIPMYFLCQIKIGHRQIIIWIILAFVLSQTLAGSISNFVDSWSEDLQYQTYIQGDYIEEALGLRNPMIYFQIIILMTFTFMEGKFKKDNLYYIFRTGYFYSTFILIFFCNYTALSGRTSTLFATFEMFMFPMITKAIPKGMIRYCCYAGFCVVLTYFLYSKYSSAMAMMSFVIN